MVENTYVYIDGQDGIVVDSSILEKPPNHQDNVPLVTKLVFLFVTLR